MRMRSKPSSISPCDCKCLAITALLFRANDFSSADAPRASNLASGTICTGAAAYRPLARIVPSRTSSTPSNSPSLAKCNPFAAFAAPRASWSARRVQPSVTSSRASSRASRRASARTNLVRSRAVSVVRARACLDRRVRRRRRARLDSRRSTDRRRRWVRTTRRRSRDRA